MLKIYKREGLWGIEHNNNICIPFCYPDKTWAILEWEHWEILNSKKQFLNHKLTLNEIEEKLKQLKS